MFIESQRDSIRPTSEIRRLALAVVDGEKLCIKWSSERFLDLLKGAHDQDTGLESVRLFENIMLSDIARLVARTGIAQEYEAAFGEIQAHLSLEPFSSGGGIDVLVRVFDSDPADTAAVRTGPPPADQRQNDLEKRIAERTQSLVNYQEELQHMARELVFAEQRERRRVSMELHDYLAQILVACRMKMESLRKSVRSKKSLEITSEIKELLDDSLTYTRTLIAELSPTVLYEAGLAAATHWLAEQMRRRGLNVEVEHDGKPIRLAEDESVMVFQSVRELLLNVVRHAETDRALVQISAGPRALTVVVSDSGKGCDLTSGIPGPASSGKYGLFSIKERAQALGGRFFLQSAPEQGMRATLVVPLLEETREAPLMPAPGMTRGPIPGQRDSQNVIRVLLADDHEMIRKALRSLLENYSDLEVIGEAADGEEAILMTRSLRPHAILMDVNMPKLNGIEATRRIRQEMAGVIIVGLSVYDDTEVAASMREAGAAAYLSKGSAPEEIYRTLRSARAHEQLYFAE